MFGNLNIICIITVKAANTDSAREFKNAKKTADKTGISKLVAQMKPLGVIKG